MFFHGTSDSSYKEIIKNGFDINLCDKNRWGKGIYLTDNIETAKAFGDKVLKVKVNEPILKFSYRELSEIFPFLSVEDEEGTPELEDYVKQNTIYKAVSIQYDDGESEIVVYDTNIISL